MMHYCDKNAISVSPIVGIAVRLIVCQQKIDQELIERMIKPRHLIKLRGDAGRLHGSGQRCTDHSCSQSTRLTTEGTNVLFALRIACNNVAIAMLRGKYNGKK